jgi:class 3 adenylate cyclase
VYAATGPVTNVAARLAALARGGQILATRETAALLSTACACRSLGPHALKNVTRPVEVVEVTNARPARRRGDRSETLLLRDMTAADAGQVSSPMTGASRHDRPV